MAKALPAGVILGADRLGRPAYFDPDDLSVHPLEQLPDLPPGAAPIGALIVDEQGHILPPFTEQPPAVPPPEAPAAGPPALPDDCDDPASQRPPRGPDDDKPTSIRDVRALFRALLGRLPLDHAEAIGYGRLCAPYNAVRQEIYSSPEAVAYRAASTNQPPPPTSGGKVEAPGGIGDAAEAILAELGVEIGQVTAHIGQVKAELEARLASSTGLTTTQIGRVAAAVSKLVQGNVLGAVPDVLSLFAAALGGEVNLVSAFLGNAADVDDVAGAVVRAVAGRQPGIFRFVLGLALTAAAGIAHQTMDGVIEGAQSPGPQHAGAAVGGGDLEPELELQLQPFTDPHSLLNPLARTLALALGVIEGALAVGHPGAEAIEQLSWELNPTRLPEPGAVVSAQLRGFIGDGVAATMARRHGYNEAAHAIQLELARTRPGADAVIEARHRRLIDPDAAERGLQRLGYRREDRELLLRVARQLLGPQVMAQLSDRDLSGAAISVTFDGSAEMTAEWADEALSAGIAEGDLARAWNAHYRAPDVGTASELLHRRFIPIEAYRAALRANAMPPLWRAALEAAVYIPFSRRDLLRLVKLELLDHGGLVDAVMDLGYSAERAEVLATMFERLAHQDAKEEKDLTRRPIQELTLDLYRGGFLTDEQTRARLVGLGIEDDVAVALVSSASVQVEVARLARIERLVRPFYLGGVWTREVTRTVLASYGLTETRAAALLEEWGLEVTYAQLRPQQQQDRDLTVGELTEAFVTRAIDEDVYRGHLKQLYVQDEEVEVKVALAAHRQAKEEQADKVAEVEHLVTTQQLDEPAAAARLSEIGLPPGKRDRLLDRWLRAPQQQRTLLTIGQLTDMVKAGILDEEEARAYLEQHPYSPQDRARLLALMGSRAADAQLRAERVAAKEERARSAEARGAARQGDRGARQAGGAREGARP